MDDPKPNLYGQHQLDSIIILTKLKWKHEVKRERERHTQRGWGCQEHWNRMVEWIK